MIGTNYSVNNVAKAHRAGLKPDTEATSSHVQTPGAVVTVW